MELNMIETKEKYDFKNLIKQIEDYIRKTELNQNDMKQINRILFKLRNIDAITSSIDEDLYSVLIENNYNDLKIYCNYFVSGQHNHISNMQTTTNNIISDIIRYVDFNLLLGNKSEIKNNIRNYKYEITRQNHLIETEVSEFMKIVQEKKKNLEEEDSNLNSLFSTFNNKLEELEKKHTSLTNDFGTLLTQSNDKIDMLINDEKLKLDENYTKESNDYKNKFDELSKEYQEKFNNLYVEITKKDNQISKLLDIVGEKARVGEYKRNADIARKERIVWQIITIALFISAFALMLYVTMCSDYDKFTILKYVVSAILMGAATYTGKQASNLRKDEVYYRKQELELSSIDVYLENMQPESKEEIKKELSSKLFGQAQNTYTNKYEEKKGFSVEDIFKIIDLKNQSRMK